ncbi:MAG: ribonuclease D [Paracoccaceae bacterium]|nr:ribonuclease D [Paracoccaceae bacterium]
MRTITTTEDLAEYCTQAAKFPYVTVDTEFLRERTYYAKLCLVQLAMPGDDDSNAVLVDPLAKGLSLAPLYDLFRDENVVKVFHAARQDLEIFFVEEGVIPSPLFDTQVAAMVCGFGDQVGYETLVRKIAREAVDKSSRFTDWSRRPLSDAQKKYALADVTHLRVVYEYLAKELEKSKRTKWVTEELGVLTEPSTYIVEPANAWKRVKTRTNSGKFMAAVAALAAFRETYAQSRNVPRNRVFKDDALVELASTKPKDMNDLNRSRLLLREARRGDIAEGILTAIVRAENVPADQIPRPEKGRDKQMVPAALADLLRVLLKAKSEEYAVAQKLICNASDLDGLASGERDLPLLKGWRGEVFGDAAIQLCEGKIALVANGKTVSTVKL